MCENLSAPYCATKLDAPNPKKIILLASGAGKAEIIRELIHGKISPKNPSKCP